MNFNLINIIESSVMIAILYLFYEVFLKKETFLKIQKILKKDKTQKQIEQKEKEKRICDLQKEIENIKENLNTKNSLMKNLNRIHK